ncbi:hypothetical protein LSTR_LSTR006949 [Laodelphax striatellus]|uniref:Uncharacterized protein n=1 Tax=Laodelphax striatellus TaxID=195883 RepID=A0A482X4K7_LAOST|nr:hypothetical protein LSTR_LSTR006949 [Laodelphax striatellus]
MEEGKTKEEDAVKLFLEIFEPADSSLSSRKNIKTFQDLISFCGRIDISSSDQLVKTEITWGSHQDLYVTTVLGLKIESRTLGWRALLAILNYFNNSNNLNEIFLEKCQRILEYLLSSNVWDSDRDYNVTLYCLNVLEHYRPIVIRHQRLSEAYVKLSEEYVRFFRNVFKICHRVAFTHSTATLTAFKCLEILIEISRICSVFDAKDNRVEICCKNDLLDIIMSNWENPVSAVRKLVKELFANWLTQDDNCNWKTKPTNKCYRVNCKIDLFECIMKSVTWRHSFEFRILVVLLESNSLDDLLESIRSNDYEFYKSEHGTKLKAGLTLSLKHHELASPGAELYRTLLDRLTNAHWLSMFHSFFKEHLTSDNRVVITNIFKYWMPATLKKYPKYSPLEVDWMLEGSTNLGYLSAIKMLRIVRKRGEWKGEEISRRFLERCLKCSDEDVRCDAFGAVCETSANVEPWEYQLVKQFLVENVNYDRSNLRQSMVNYCVTFFLRVRGSVIAKSNTQDAINFVDDLHKFLTANLEKHCNYQRKMTSLMLFNAVMIYFGIGGSREKDQRKSNTRDKSGVIEEQANKAGKWHFRSKKSRKLLISCIDDISDSVRNIASDILINHFKWDKHDQEELNRLYVTGKEKCSSRLFYEIESGALLIKTITILAFKSDYSLIVNMLKNSNANVFNETKVPNVMFDLIKLAKRQLIVISKDIFMASVQGHPLHGVLRALLLLVADRTQFDYKESLRNEHVKYVFNEPSGTFLTFSNTNYYAENKPGACGLFEDIVTILEKNVKTMIALLSFNRSDAPDDMAFSPSFAEMGKSLEELVKQSEMSCNHDDEVLMLSVPHQLVLNCIWFNLKICCVFASSLITSGLVNSKEGSCARCFAIIETVLNKCRHKGAMDVAGSSMFSAAKAVMERREKFSDEDKNLPARILDEFFKNIRSDAGCSLSRRSAGRSFLVHSIVASDPRPNSPLLSKTLSKLIEIISDDAAHQNQIEDSLVDVPQVSALHILSTLVQDSRLNILTYAKEIFSVCFEKLSSSVYTVKNAALQLFRSLLMRLIRRMKGECSELDNHQTTPLEELYLNMPQLFSFVEKKLDHLSSETDINSHAKLIPILILLSNLSVTVFKEYNESYKEFAENIRKFVGRLLSSRVFFVRKLSARINSNMLLPDELSTDVNLTAARIEQACLDNLLDQNLLHGLVMNMKYLSIRLISLKEIHPKGAKGEIEAEHDTLQCLITLIKVRETSYFVKSLAMDVIKLWQPTFTFRTHRADNLATMKSSIVHYKPHLGSSLWLAKIVENICGKNARYDLKKLCLLENRITDVALACLRVCEFVPLSNETEDGELVLDMIRSSREPEVIEQLLRKLLDNFVFNDLKLLDCIFDVIVNKSSVGFKCLDIGLGMLVACKILSSRSDDEFFSSDISLGVLKCLYEWSSSSQLNEDLRSVAAECVICFRAFFLKKMTTRILIENEVFDQNSDKLGVLLWKTLFNLLQDENLEIRMKTCNFFPSFYKSSKLDVPNPFVALHRLVQIKYMLQIMNLKTAIDQLWTVLSTESSIRSNEMSSPYDHGIDNFYKDETWMHAVIKSEFKRVCDESMFCQNYLEERYKYVQ